VGVSGMSVKRSLRNSLMDWCRVPSSWPVHRDLGVFIRRFECHFHTMLVDLFDDPLIREAM
jgi:hypothetical protein